MDAENKAVLPPYLPRPLLTVKSPPPTYIQPQSKKQKLNLPPPNMPSVSTPTKMDQNAMDVHIRKQRLNSLDALVRDSIADNSSSDEYDDIQIAKESKQTGNEDLTIDDDKLIALINSSSGARKGWMLMRELLKYDASVYHLRDLSVNETIMHNFGEELLKYRGKCLVLICGGDGSQAWAASLIDKCIAAVTMHESIPFPPICVFPMGTGNDLSRCLGWGSLEPNHKNILQSIADVKFCSKITKRWSDLDRWRVTYTFDNIIEHDIPIANDPQINHTIDNVMDIDRNKYEIKPAKQFYIQQHPSSQAYKHIHKFDPPLPSTFLCYLSIGYDALVAYKFAQERREHPDRFNNQIKNQVMYVKHGFTEFFKPSEPINDCIDVLIGNKNIALPTGCRSLKVININSAMNGLFFWGAGKSRDFEYQQQHRPQLDDGKLEVMATRGVHDMIAYRANISHAQRISQCNDVILRFKNLPKDGIALQIDGEAWIIRQECSLRIQIHDKLPVVVGYNQPRGVQSWLMASLDDEHIVKAKETFRARLKNKYENKTDKVRPDHNSDSEQSITPTPTSSDEDKEKESKNIVDKILNQSSSSILSLFNINNVPPNASDEEEKDGNNSKNKKPPAFFDKIGELLKIQKSAEREREREDVKSQEVMERTPSFEEVDITQYVENNPCIKNDKNNILQSSIFSAKKNGLFLDKFTWWKVTRAKNYDKAIDAETATDAIASGNKHENIRKTKSFAVLSKKGRSASLF